MSKFPLRSLANAIHLPSGDHAGFSSHAAPLVILLRAAPFGAIVAMSKSWPVASEVAIARRLPFGDQLGSTSMPGPPEGRMRWPDRRPITAIRTGPPRSLPNAITGRGEAAPATLPASATNAAVPDTTARAISARRDLEIPLPPQRKCSNGCRMVTRVGEDNN